LKRIKEKDQWFAEVEGKINKMILFLIFAAFPIILIFLLLKAKKGGKTNLLPGPIGLPFIGNLHQYDTLKGRDSIFF